MPEPTLYLLRSPRRWFLIPEGAILPPGELTLRTVHGRRLRVSPEAALPYELGAEQGALLEKEAREALGQQGREILEKMAPWSQTARAVSTVLREARAGEDPGTRPTPERLLEALGTSTDALKRRDDEPARVGAELLGGLFTVIAELLSEDPELRAHAVARQEALAAALAPLGVSPEQLDTIVLVGRSLIGEAAVQAAAAAPPSPQALAERQWDAVANALIAQGERPGEAPGERWQAEVARAVQTFLERPEAARSATATQVGAALQTLAGLASDQPEARAEAAGRLEALAQRLEPVSPEAAQAARALLARAGLNAEKTASVQS